jgi:PAS domain S-box-containing protein
MKRAFTHPGLLITITLIFSVILVTVTAFDIYSGYNDIYKAKSEEAAALLRSVQKAGENAYISSSEVEQLIIDKLLSGAYLISEIEKKEKLTPQKLNELSLDINVDHIQLFSQNRIEEENTNKPYSDLNIPEGYADEIDSIRSGKYDYYVDAAAEDMSGFSHLLVLQRRRAKPDGIIAVSVESASLLEFRKKIGIGSLFQKLADNKDIQYVLLQDSIGIIAASGNIDTNITYEYKEFATSDSVVYRELNLSGNSVYEASSPFIVDNERYGIIRIGLSLSLINELETRIISRTIITSLFLLLVGIILFIYLARYQNYLTLKSEYDKMQSYTGNILENMSDAVIAADSAGRITLFNKAAETLFGKKAKEVLGKSHKFLFNSEDNIIAKSLRSRSSVYYTEQKLELNSRKSIIIGGSVSLIEADGNIDTVVTLLRDITSQKEFEEEKKRNEKLNAMGELAGSVAHEIKNPLNLINITAQRFEKEFVPDSDKEEYYQLIKSMRQEVTRAAEIVNQFLKFARPPKIQKMETELRELIDDIRNSFGSAAIKNNINFSCECENIRAFIDREQFSRALINLIQNAFDALVNGGSVSLKAYIADSKIVIEISDSGKGIAPEEIDKIFDIYFTTKPSGSGLGLSIASQIISAHQGILKVKSEIQRGTVFTIEMPLK